MEDNVSVWIFEGSVMWKTMFQSGCFAPDRCESTNWFSKIEKP